MHRPFLSIALVLCPLLSCTIVGCGDTVLEDRTITFSADGQSVAFQHGTDGVFVADSKSGQLEKIFQPDERTLATSTPLWSPDRNRVLFTTAVDLNQDSDEVVPAALEQWDDAPQGRTFRERAVRYTCWLREMGEGVQPAKPVALFEETCMHVGYIAANLAVRWHPDGRRVLYLKQMDKNRHGVHEFDLATKKTKQVFPHTADRILFDWSPDGSQLVCVLRSSEAGKEDNGIWIGQPDQDNWWHVPDSSGTFATHDKRLIENLRASRPAWSSDATRFAFLVSTFVEEEEIPQRFAVRVGNIGTREVRTLTEGENKFTDIRWTPDGKRLALVLGTTLPSLRFLDLKGELSDPINDRPVRRFVGWDVTGERLAYVVPDRIPFISDGNHWAILFEPQPLARDAVMLAPGDGSGAGDEVFSGMRVTFPHWSPTQQKLSLWCTFSPTVRSWLSRILQWGLRPGDPAATLDVETGDITWMTVNPQEKVQVGHHYMLKRDYETALRWYEEASEELPPPKPPKITEVFESMVGPRNFAFFHYCCLAKLGRTKEAAEKLAEFERTFLPTFSPDSKNENMQPAANQPVHELFDPSAGWPRLLRNLYMTEVFLALDAADEGERYFADAIESAPSERAKLMDAVMLAQLYLLQHRNSEFADFATRTLAPLLLNQVDFENYGGASTGRDPNHMLSPIFVMAILPMFAADFLDTIPQEKVAALLPEWLKLCDQARHDAERLGCDLFLREAYRRLGNQREQTAVETRIAENPSTKNLLPEGGVTEIFRKFQEEFQTTGP